jgi:predicted DsbA family dithiol-disulfide isomerase
MRVEIWSDVVCPWCYIGKRRFEAALEGFEHADEVEVVWRSFELDPRAPFRPSRPMADELARKYGRSLDEARAMLAHMDEMAAGEGLDFDLAATTGGNTFAAHRLIHLAAQHGRAAAMKEALLDAYFRRRVAVSDPDVLAEVAAGVGLPDDEVRRLLEGDELADEVRADEREAAKLGISAVPYFVIDRTFGIPGAQDRETMLAALRRAWDRSHPTLEEVTPAAACGPDGCRVDTGDPAVTAGGRGTLGG